MTAAQLHEHLLAFTEEEQFYKQYHAARQSADTLAAFIASVDPAEISKKRFVLPELKERLDLHFVSEEWFWDGKEQDIAIHKHPRFMPEWDFVHEFYEIMYAYQGEFSLFIGADEIRMKQGHVCIIPPGIAHRISIFDDSICFNIKVRKSTFASSFAPLLSSNDLLSNFFLNTLYIGDYKDYILFKSDEDERVLNLMRSIYMESLTHLKYHKRIMNGLLSLVFLQLMRAYEETIETSAVKQENHRKITAVLSYINANFRTVTLKQLAQEFYFSEQYMSKYIKENTGMTMQELVRAIRIRHAKQLLKTSDLNIGQISESCGYASPEHFVRTFKKEVGLPPRAYREQLNRLK